MARGRVLGFGLAFYALLAAAGLSWMHWRGDALSDRLLAPNVPAWRAVSAGVLTGLLIVVFAERFLRDARWAVELRNEVAELLRPLTVPIAVATALVSGIAEEILFRGAMQPALGLTFTTLLFAVLHGGFAGRWLGWTIFAAATGALLGALAVWSGGVLAPAIAHVVVNGIELSLLARVVPQR